ncbi:hypothetical protein ACLSU7_17340 [Bdellovibrio sp. HCB185ZH]|uniref:hypothetical protein n=1 Tax=Bdellovibrio sp. HCB185ZH TaxID=3394235 RepID=UPI0039A7101E
MKVTIALHILLLILIAGCSFTKKTGGGEGKLLENQVTAVQKNILSSIRMRDNEKLRALVANAQPSDLDFETKDESPVGLAYKLDNAEAIKILLDAGFSPFALGSSRKEFSDSLFIYLIEKLHDLNSESPHYEVGKLNASGKILEKAQSQTFGKIFRKIDEYSVNEALSIIQSEHVDLAIFEYVVFISSQERWNWVRDGGDKLKYKEGYGVRSKRNLDFLRQLTILDGSAEHIQILYQLEMMNLFRFSFADTSYFTYLYRHPKLTNRLLDVGGSGLFVTVDMLFKLAEINGSEFFEGKRGTDVGVKRFLQLHEIEPSKYSFVYIEKNKTVKSYPMYAVSQKFHDEIYNIVTDFIRSDYYEFDLKGIRKQQDISELMSSFLARNDLETDMECHQGETADDAANCDRTPPSVGRGPFVPDDLPDIE